MRELEQLLDTLADRVASRVVDRLRATDMPGYVDQAQSPLGRRRHIEAIRSGALPGVQVGRRYLAKQDDLDRYIAEQASKPKRKPEPDEEGVEALADELGIERL